MAQLPYQLALEGLQEQEKEKLAQQQADDSFKLPYEQAIEQRKEEEIKQYEQPTVSPLMKQAEKYRQQFVDLQTGFVGDIMEDGSRSYYEKLRAMAGTLRDEMTQRQAERRQKLEEAMSKVNESVSTLATKTGLKGVEDGVSRPADTTISSLSEKDYQAGQDRMDLVYNIRSNIDQMWEKNAWMKEKLGSQFQGTPVEKLREAIPERMQELEEEYNKEKQTASFLASVAEHFDADLRKRLGENRLIDLEESEAVRKSFNDLVEGASLGVLSPQDLAALGKDVYFKDGQMYYKDFPIANEFLTEEGAKAKALVGTGTNILSSFGTYAGVAGLISKGVTAMATAKNLGKVSKVFQAFNKFEKAHPILAEVLGYNVAEELTEVAVRKGTGQEYTFSNFLQGLGFGAVLGGAMKGLGIRKIEDLKKVENKELKKVVEEAEVEAKKMIDQGMSPQQVVKGLKDIRLGDTTLGNAFSTFKEQRLAGLTGIGKPEGRPGIEKAAPLPEVSPELKPLYDEAKKYKSAEEFVKSQQIFYHGTNEPFEKLSLSKTGLASGNKYGGENLLFFTSDKKIAKTYAKADPELIKAYGLNPRIIEASIKIENPLVIDAKGRGYGAIHDEAIKTAKKNGNDGLIIKNVLDTNDAKVNRPQELRVVFKDSQIKTKEELTDIYNQATGKIALPKETLKTDKFAWLRGDKEGKALSQDLELRKKELMNKGEKMINDYIEEMLKPNMVKGVEQGKLIRDEEGKVVGREGRKSNNDKWYSDFYKKNNRKPNKKELKEIAIRHLAEGHTDYTFEIPANKEFLNVVEQVEILNKGIDIDKVIKEQSRKAQEAVTAPLKQERLDYIKEQLQKKLSREKAVKEGTFEVAKDDLKKIRKSGGMSQDLLGLVDKAVGGLTSNAVKGVAKVLDMATNLPKLKEFKHFAKSKLAKLTPQAGLPDDVYKALEDYRKMQNTEFKGIQEFTKQLSEITKKKVSKEDAFKYLSGEDVKLDKEVRNVLDPIRDEIDIEGLRQVQIGNLKKEVFEVNVGKYMRRLYAAHKVDGFSPTAEKYNNLIKAFQEKGKIIQSEQIKRKGEQSISDGENLIAKGKELNKEALNLKDDKKKKTLIKSRNFIKKGKGKISSGKRLITKGKKIASEKFSLEDAEDAIMGIMTKNIKDKFKGLMPSGIKQGGDFTKRRKLGDDELSLAIRDFLEEVQDPEYVIGKTLFDLKRSRINAEFLKDLEGTKYVVDEIPAGEFKNYKKLGDGYGALEGKFLKKDIFDYMEGMKADSEKLSKTLTKLNNFMKANLTVRNPGGQFRNLTSNFATSQSILGHNFISPSGAKDLVDSIKSIKNKDNFYKELLAYGRLGDTGITRDLGNRLEEVVGEFEKGGKVKQFIKKIDGFLGESYEFGDNMFLMANYKKLRAKGLKPLEALQQANRVTPDYGEIPPLIAQARRSVIGLPFVTWRYKVYPEIVKAALNTPVRTTMPVWFPITVANLVASQLDLTDEEKEVFKTSVYRDGMIPIGRAENGDVTYMNFSQYTPFADLFKGRYTGEDTALGFLPDQLEGYVSGTVPGIGSFPVQAMLNISQNHDPFSGRQISYEDAWTPKWGWDVASYLAPQLLPVIGTGVRNVERTVQGDMEPWEALLKTTTGLKAESLGVGRFEETEKYQDPGFSMDKTKMKIYDEAERIAKLAEKDPEEANKELDKLYDENPEQEKYISERVRYERDKVTGKSKDQKKIRTEVSNLVNIAKVDKEKANERVDQLYEEYPEYEEYISKKMQEAVEAM